MQRLTSSLDIRRLVETHIDLKLFLQTYLTGAQRTLLKYQRERLPTVVASEEESSAEDSLDAESDGKQSWDPAKLNQFIIFLQTF